MIAAGSTVMVTVNGVPTQLPVEVVGVTLYVAVPVTDKVLPKSPVSVAPEPETPPEMPVPIAGALHTYVVPVGIVPVGV
jgi:hypothetical protein